MKFLVLFLCFATATASAQCPNCSGVNPYPGPNPTSRLPICQYITVCNQFGQMCHVVEICR